MNKSLFCKCLAGMLGVCWVGANQVRAAISTQTVTIPAQTLIAPTGTNPTNLLTKLTSNFAKFNPALGTLTGVTFNYDYELQLVMAGAGGGSGGSAAGPVDLNGVTSSLIISGGSGGAGPGTVPFSETGSFSPTGDLSTYIGTGQNSFAWEANDNVSPSGSPDFTSALNLVSPSSLGVTYTYTTAVPEPAALGGLIAESLLLMNRRRRT